MDFQDENLSYTPPNNANLVLTFTRDAYHSGATLYKCRYVCCQFSLCMFVASDLTAANLEKAILYSTDLSGANTSGSGLCYTTRQLITRIGWMSITTPTTNLSGQWACVTKAPPTVAEGVLHGYTEWQSPLFNAYSTFAYSNRWTKKEVPRFEIAGSSLMSFAGGPGKHAFFHESSPWPRLDNVLELQVGELL